MNIVLCATQRCGSTMIVEDMRNTGILGCPEEWFVPWNPEKTNVNWSSAFASVVKRSTGDNGISSVKVMANQLYNIDSCLNSFTSPLDDGEYPCFAKVFEFSNWVWLKRNDVVSQAISRIMARQTGVNHATQKIDDEHFAGNLLKGYDPKYNDKAQYRYGAILKEVTSITLENLTWNRFFESHGISPTVLTYEDTVRDTEMSHLDLLAKMVGLTERPERRPRSMVKVGNNKNRRWRDRFYNDVASRSFE